MDDQAPSGIKEIDLDLFGLGIIEGSKHNTVFKHHLKRLADDCYNRPGDSKPRKLTLTVTLEPELQEDGNCETVKLGTKWKSSIPDHRTEGYELRIKAGGALAFNEDSPKRYPQRALPFAEHDDAPAG